MPSRLQDRDAAIDGPALGDAAKVDAHAGSHELDGAGLAIHAQLPVVDARQGGRDLCVAGVQVSAVVVEVADARVGDVEGAVAQARVLDGLLDDVDDVGDPP